MISDDPLPSISVTLERIETDDRIQIDGALAVTNTKRLGLLFVHGLGSTLFKTRHLWERIAQHGRRYGIGVLALQTRGHDISASYRIKQSRRSYRVGGAGYEIFNESLFDIGAGVRHLAGLGYKRVVLLGHSTGANKVAHYAAKKRDRRVRGVILAGPARDLTLEVLRVGSVAKQNRLVQKIQAFSKSHGRHTTLPEKFAGHLHISAQRYLSLYRAGSSEDVFPYGEPSGRWTTLGSIRVPLCIIFGGDDQYLGKHTPEYIVGLINEKAKRASSVSADVLPGNGHSFQEDPDAFAKSAIGWMRTALL